MIQFADIKPISIFLPDEEKWMLQFEKAKEYFASQGLDTYFVEGIHSEKWWAATVSSPLPCRRET